jgi:hypothetical protein
MRAGILLLMASREPEGGWSLLAEPEAIRILSSPLLSDDEIGELASLTITFRANQNGGTHAAACRNVSVKAADAETRTIAAFRTAGSGRRPCQACGGGILAPLSAEQREQITGLAPVLDTRLQQERENAAARRRMQELIHRADVIDERARRIVDGWHWHLEREKETVAGYPAAVVSAHVTCPDCGAMAAVTFEPRALRVSFTCREDAAHGYFQLPGEEDEPLPTWRHGGRGYIAIALVAPVLAGDDDAWNQVYGTRAADYRATTDALAAFDAADFEPMRLTPNIRCGECGNAMSSFTITGPGSDEESYYECGIRHTDGRFSRSKKDDADAVIDWKLLRLLRQHPSWATAPELEPPPATVAQYADYLAAKIEIYDAHIGAAGQDPDLSRQREELDNRMDTVNAIQEQGALAVAGLTSYRPGHWLSATEPAFTTLARALLTTLVKVSENKLTISTPLDAGTPLYRTLRVREIRDELAELERRQQELGEELAELSAAD